ncbi:response regulator [Jidongwangia harbinensis]|uniref:response regulator n=1 Tax=Jidongwangia harbinensis TaxID=2878561 RepID=UPI0027DF383A|nr:response regulator [Jidongwangia harbinensis]
MLTLIAEALFAAVFARVLLAYLRRRDPLQAAVAVMFSAASVFFVLAVLRQTVGEPPRLVTLLVSALLLGQAFLTMRVVRRVGPLPGWVYHGALVAWLASAAVLVSGQARTRAVVLTVVAMFVVAELCAAAFLARLAGSRRGSPRTRLWLATAATVLFAAAVLVAGVGSLDADRVASVRQLTQLLVLLSAAGYVMAFTPPAFLRRSWSSRAAYGVVRRLLQEPPDAEPEQIWRCYAESVRAATDAGAVVVLVRSPEDDVRELARVGVPAAAVPGPAVGEVTTLRGLTGTVDLSGGGPAAEGLPAARAYAGLMDARFITTAPMDLPAGQGVLLLLHQYRSLFAADDVQLLGDLGGQAAALAQRAVLLADRDRLTAELSASVTALTAASEAKNDFMANMSHELRTPLNAIIGFSDLMRIEESVDGETRVPTDWIQHIHSSGQHLVGLINEVLDLAKIEAGKVELRRETLDLSTELGEVVTTLAALSRHKSLEVTVAAAPLPVFADRVRLRQIVTNLLSNAIKFTPEHGRIYLAARRVGADIAISVADTGPGIAAADQQRVFDEFQQVGEPHAAAAGTGLGLALARRLVQAHGGRIELESIVGHGAKFTVYLPATSAHTASPGDLAGACPGVLIVEDDPAAAQLLSAYLEKAGYRLHVARTGEEGLAAARACPPEVILLDVQLPGIDGWEVLARLKDDERLRNVPVVIVSVLDDAEVGLALGAADYFVKPVDRRALLSWLARHGLVPPGGGPELSVLVVDDDPVCLELIEAALSGSGIRVTRAGGGADGVRQARSHRFDLVICDLLMPEVDGFDVVAALNADPATRDVPVLILTTHDLDDAEKERLRGRVVGVTAKDRAENLTDLARTVAELTGVAAARDPVSA